MQLLVFGGSGALGRSVVKQFYKTWSVTSVDYQSNLDSHKNIILEQKSDIKQQLHQIKQNLEGKFDCIICVSGGWRGGSIKDDDFLEVYEQMNRQNVIPSLICCNLASQILNVGGLLVLTGASTVFSGPTPEMIGYALAKTSVHTLAMNMFGNYLPQDGSIVTILPETIDTPQNRISMPTADFSKWANPDQISGLIRSWAEGLNRPASGSMAHLRVKNSTVVPEFI